MDAVAFAAAYPRVFHPASAADEKRGALFSGFQKGRKLYGRQTPKIGHGKAQELFQLVDFDDNLGINDRCTFVSTIGG